MGVRELPRERLAGLRAEERDGAPGLGVHERQPGAAGAPERARAPQRADVLRVDLAGESGGGGGHGRHAAADIRPLEPDRRGV